MDKANNLPINKMIKTALFLSKRSFEDHLKASSSMIAISIGVDTDGKPPRLDRGFAGAIRLCFDDVYEESIGLSIGDLPDLHARHESGVRLFVGDAEICDYNDATRIIKFLEHYAAKPEPFELVVHCLAGVSRSAAVAQFAADKYGAELVGANPDTSGSNRRLLRLLNKVAAGSPASCFDPGKVVPGRVESKPAARAGIF